LVTGPTGSGKSTTLAAIIDEINRKRKEHIITIEDPIEFVHVSKNCVINHREVNTHTRSFASALRAALREDPDIILVGEMRDLETIRLAIEAANTGHLVLSTLHTSGAVNTVDRVIEVFPEGEQAQIRSTLADSLRAIISQALFKRIDLKGRIAVMEILVATHAVRAMIRDSKSHQILSAMQTGKKYGMQTLDDGIAVHLQAGKVSADEAYMKCVDKERFKTYLKESPADFTEV
jgi:twitching motility protein PilT